MEFQKRTDAIGGAGWANVTILPEKPHLGYYQWREIWNYLEFSEAWIHDHSPNGTQPLSEIVTPSSSWGNRWDDVIMCGGHAAAVARQAPPTINAEYGVDISSEVEASVGSWDHGMKLEAQWLIDGKPVGEKFAVKQSGKLKHTVQTAGDLPLFFSGSKRNYATEMRRSNQVQLGA